LTHKPNFVPSSTASHKKCSFGLVAGDVWVEMDPCPFGWFNGDYTISKNQKKNFPKIWIMYPHVVNDIHYYRAIFLIFKLNKNDIVAQI
jgi:hypothetical protein